MSTLAPRIWCLTAGYGCSLTGNNPTTEQSNNVLNINTELNSDNGDRRSCNAGRAGASTAGPGPEDGVGGRNSSGGARDAECGAEEAGGREQRGARGRKKARSRARLKIATLNIRGYGPAAGVNTDTRWMLINQLVRDEKIAVLAVQEAHLDAERVLALNNLFGRHLHVFHSALPENPTGACGVAFVLNKRFLDYERCAINEIVAGRAISLTFSWVGERVLRVLNVYGPNAHASNAEFWNTIWTAGVGRTDLLLGDFNVVEDGLDRIPARTDPGRATDALRELITEMRVLDGWRKQNPSEKAYTYMQKGTGAQSRLDRIYISASLQADAVEWTLKESGVPTDHKMAILALANRREPFMGKGRWSMPTHLLTDEKTEAVMRELGRKLILGIEEMGERTEARNPQTLYRDFKNELTSVVRNRAKEKVPKLQRRLEKLRVDLQKVLNGPNVPARGAADDGDKQRRAAILQERVDMLEQKLFAGRRRTVATKHWVQNETMSKYWTRPNVAPLPSIVIPELHRTDFAGGGYTTNSKQMAETARAHYDGLQDVDPMGVNEPHNEYIAEALGPAKAKLSNVQKAHLASKLTSGDVTVAIAEAASNKAPGLDGLPTEVWKAYVRWFAADVKKGVPATDMAKALACVFNDVAANGMIPESTFAEGWICPIYKLKKDVREIVNYRPITLLNSDYKLMTKAMAMKLAECAPSLIHPDQAGFVPGRRIFDHIQLSKLIIAYCEAEEINGAIVALDQEKAYDRIDHEYLWATLRHMNFPNNFINAVRNLYASAMSCVIVNGTRSRMYRIWRGVRQGDPMSCLLFDFAIEPLACALRASSLRGLLIPGDTERLIATLFADDTTVFLGEGDDYASALAPTDVWCRASRAKFNLQKTEVIPLGSPAFRAEVVTTRKLGPRAAPIPSNVHIVKDGEAVRSLGAWIGNNADGAAPWNAMIRTMEKNLKGWSKGKPTLLGRKLAIDLEVGGRSQFLAKAQGMPKEVEERITRMIADFMWNGDKHPRIARDTLYASIEEGGLNVLNVVARNEAIDLMRLSDYLNMSMERPRWALVADAILAKAVASSAKGTEPKARLNSFLQKWEISTRYAAKLPPDLRRMVIVAKKYGVRCDVCVAKKNLKNAMPVWYHLGMESGRTIVKTIAGACLRERHGVRTVAQCAEVAERLRPENVAHVGARDCECGECVWDRTVRGCENPHKCATAAERHLEKLKPKWSLSQLEVSDGLSLTKSRIAANRVARAEKGRIVFDPTVAQDEPLAAVFRVFTDPARDTFMVAARPPRPFTVPDEEVEVYTDGSCSSNGSATARAGSGAWFGADDERNEGVRVPYDEQTNQTAEIYAVVLAERKVPPYVPLHIVSDSKYVVDGMTLHLKKWENRGWIGVANAAPFAEAAAALRGRSVQTTFRWVKGHSNILGNEGADKLAAAGAELPRQFRPTHLPQFKFMRDGAAVQSLSQSLAYKGVKRAMRKEQRKPTASNLAEITEAIWEACGEAPRSEMVWRALRKDPVSRPIRDFLWKSIHGAQRIGKYWLHIPNYEERAKCRKCNVVEDMRHILTTCCVPGRTLIWRIAQAILAKKGVRMPGVSLGLALGTHLFTAIKEDGTVDRGATRAARLILTEAVHAIWVLRCERVIGWSDEPERVHSEQEIRNRFAARINKRIVMDQGATNVRVHKRKATKVAKVKATWSGLLKNEEDIPDNWMSVEEVLVGIPSAAELRDLG